MKEQLICVIVEFVAEVAWCWKMTHTAQDRSVYQQDIALAGWWLAQLREVEPQQVAEEILSAQTHKHFYDYWRDGECGERETIAFVALTQAVEALLRRSDGNRCDR